MSGRRPSRRGEAELIMGGGHERVEKMTPKREIKAKEVVEEILSGMADDDLMQRYGLTPEELDSVLRHLVDSGFMTRQQLQEREQLSHSQIIKAFVDSRTDTRELD